MMTENGKPKHNVLTIMKKELRRFFGDRRMLVTILLPGILIYFIYSLMGDFLMDAFLPDEEVTYTVQFLQMPASVDTLWTAAGVQQETAAYDSREEALEAVKAQDLDLYVVFPEDFDEQTAVYDPADGQPAPAVEIFYNSASTDSSAAYNLLVSLLDGYESALANRFDINRDADTVYDMATSEDITGMMFSMLMPLLLITLLFSACMAVAPESIAGEKERGTIATLLVTPLRRSELALGKILALSIVSMTSGVVSFLGLILSLPKLMGGEESGVVMDATIYGLSDYAWILAVILSTVLLFVSFISILSAFAKSVKEAASFVSVLMILVLVIGVSGMMGAESLPALPYFLIPIYNSVQAIGAVFGDGYTPMIMVLTIISNLAVTSLLVWILTRMFNSEKIMFNS